MTLVPDVVEDLDLYYRMSVVLLDLYCKWCIFITPS